MDKHQTGAGGVLIPAGQAALSGVFVGLATWALARFLNWPQAGSLALLVATGAAAWSWAHLVRRWLGVLEFSSGMEPEAPPAAPERVRVEVIEQDGRRGTYADLPASLPQLVRLGRGLIEGQSLAESNWIGTGRPFSRGGWESLRDELLARGLIRWRDPGYRPLGLELTPAGRAAARVFASLAAAPTPELLEHSSTATERSERVSSE